MNMEQQNTRLMMPIDKLHEWSSNPRSIQSKDFDRLKKQLYKNKQEQGDYLFKPLVIAKDGTVLGGNFRLKALRELGATDVWVSIVKAETEKEKLEYALMDNDRAGSYTEELANLSAGFPEIEWRDYAIDFHTPISLDTLVNPKIDEVLKEQFQKEKKVIVCPSCKFEFTN